MPLKRSYLKNYVHACMWMRIYGWVCTCVSRCAHGGQKMASDLPGAGVIGSYEPLNVVLGNTFRFETAEPSL